MSQGGLMTAIISMTALLSWRVEHRSEERRGRRAV